MVSADGTLGRAAGAQGRSSEDDAMEYRYEGIWRDTELLKEIQAKLRARGVDVEGVRQRIEQESTGDAYRPAPGTVEEAIVLGVGRPALFVQGGTFSLPSSDIWNQRLTVAKPALEAVLPCVGRVQLGQGPKAQMIGTGWLIAPDVIVTNRHVARAFSQTSPGWAFKPDAVDPTLDFKVEHQRSDADAVALAKIIHIEEDGRADMALIRIARSVDRRPIELARRIFGPEDVAVIGYPAWDGDRNPGPDMAKIFGEAFQVKRLAPGTLLSVADDKLEHDCSTLGGNSGSVVWGLQARKALGLHFAGRFREANYAVPAPVIEAIATAQKVL
jgi:endonuclease G, mitochondrial